MAPHPNNSSSICMTIMEKKMSISLLLMGTKILSHFFSALEALPEYPWINIEVKTKEAFARSIEGVKGLRLLP